MPSLLELQRSFSAALLGNPAEDVARHVVEDRFGALERLGIYRNTCRSTLVEALRMAYPAVARLVGGEFFDAAGGEYVDCHPARSAYLNEYGDAFADFLAGLQAARGVPYLPEVARFEWALSVAANAEDAPMLEAGDLLAVEPRDHDRLVFVPHPSVSLLELAYPADQIADAVMSGDEQAMGEVDLSSGPARVVVHRGRTGLEAQRLDAESYRLVSRLFAGDTLGSLIGERGAATLIAEQLAKGRLTAFRVAQR